MSIIVNFTIYSEKNKKHHNVIGFGSKCLNTPVGSLRYNMSLIFHVQGVSRADHSQEIA